MTAQTNAKQTKTGPERRLVDLLEDELAALSLALALPLVDALLEHIGEFMVSLAFPGNSEFCISG
jgi:hypothetical protein